MDEIIKQAPQEFDIKIIEEIFKKNNNDITKTLMEIWDVKENEKKEISKIQEHWNDIRDTCDAFDIEMTKVLNEAKKNTVKL